MKLAEIQVPEDFISTFIPDLDSDLRKGASLFITTRYDTAGREFPSGPVKVVTHYPDIGIVRLKSDDGIEYLVRRTETRTESPGSITRKWLFNKFEMQIESIMDRKSLAEAAAVMKLPPVALWSKLKRAQRNGIPVPLWFT